MAWWNQWADRQWRNRVAGALEMPQDVIIGLPKVTVIGYLQVTIENHRGIIEFTPQRVRIAAGEGSVEVYGQDLSLRYLIIAYESVGRQRP